MKKEADVKDAVKKVLKAEGIWHYMPVQTGYGVKGIPDFVCCVKGHFLGIETKFGGNTLSTWQEIQIRNIRESGGTVLVINEQNVGELKVVLRGVAALINK